MSTQNRILVWAGSGFVVLYIAVVIYSLLFPGENIKPNPLWHAAAGIFLIGLGAFGIENAKKFNLTLGKFRIGLETERYKPSSEEVTKAIEESADTVTPDREREAAILADKAISRSEEERSAADFLILATNAWKSKDFETAIYQAQQGLSIRPANTRLHATLTHRLASVYRSIGAIEIAERLYRRSITEDPTFAQPHYNLSLLFFETGRKEEAEKECRQAISLDPKHVNAHTNLGILLSETGRNEEAEKEYRQAISLDPKDVNVHINLGNLLSETGRNEEAEKEYRQAISLDPKNELAHNNLGFLLSETGRKEDG